MPASSQLQASLVRLDGRLLRRDRDREVLLREVVGQRRAPLLDVLGSVLGVRVSCLHFREKRKGTR